MKCPKCGEDKKQYTWSTTYCDDCIQFWNGPILAESVDDDTLNRLDEAVPEPSGSVSPERPSGRERED